MSSIHVAQACMAERFVLSFFFFNRVFLVYKLPRSLELETLHIRGFRGISVAVVVLETNDSTIQLATRS